MNQLDEVNVPLVDNMLLDIFGVRSHIWVCIVYCVRYIVISVSRKSNLNLQLSNNERSLYWFVARDNDKKKTLNGKKLY